MNSKNALKVNKDTFDRYVEVQYSGVTNMYNAKLVCELGDLTMEEYLYIIQNYTELADVYGINC